ncbi:MAG TPA: DUF302 domain-containing protein [Candidatus Nanoarchaeia archaeon]|nr:DUF302 domain-containing protein [Candidatus Nanoarchaeia archaeon]
MYQYKKEVNLSYDRAVARARERLQKEGFGVLTEIDVKSTLKKKLDVDFDDYIILGACNPPFAYRALQAEQDLGLMLPCNLIVYSHKGKTFVAAIKPTVQMEKIGNVKLKEVAVQVEEKLKKVVDSL